MRRIRWQTIIHGLIGAVALTSQPALADDGWSFWPFRSASYQQHPGDGGPPGQRQVEMHGKLWPPFPRPTGEPQPYWQAYHSVHYWPYPYDCQDRGDVHALLDAQAGAGWVVATTLHDYHFDSDTQKLTDAGRTHLIWVLNSVPPQFRTVYVAQGSTMEMGQLRAANAEQFLRESGCPNIPGVVVKPETFAGRQAIEVDRIRMLELQSIPRPRLFLIGVAGRQGGAAGGSMGGQASGGASPGGGQGSTITQPR